MEKRIQPKWKPPQGEDAPKLKLYNSLTRRKEIFVPQKANQVSWYSCGPTVYDASHMGHARSYISFDILRRVLSDYFGYNVTYVMNITDIDDKIIKRARQNHLYDDFINAEHCPNEVLEIVEQLHTYMHKNMNPVASLEECNLFNKRLEKVSGTIAQLKEGTPKSNIASDYIKNIVEDIRDPFSEYLDTLYRNKIENNDIFSKLSKYWEEQFHKDMDALNILRPNVLTRVSEYIPEIIRYIEQIIDLGFAYASHNSVYFDVETFNNKPDHFYAKLVPEAYGDTKSLQDGEGVLSMNEESDEKKSPNDFALWKASKDGEPRWQSPWGEGRPGWHIECSVMASDILGSSLDIHTGGVDLKFPHHDNEIAQAEAYYNNDCWVKYFLHSGHLTIAGCKMSKSLKNFITIKDALKKYSARQLRLVFLLHSWKDTLDYSDNSMEMALTYERLLNEFFLNVKDIMRTDSSKTIVDSLKKHSATEAALTGKFKEIVSSVHLALCDNVDTRLVLELLRICIAHCNVYIRDHKSDLNRSLLWDIASYITKIMRIFGVISTDDTIGFPVTLDSKDNAKIQNLEELVMPFLTVLSNFRNDVRIEAIKLKATPILRICDSLRDDVLPNVGVRLEDREGEKPAIKLVDKETLLREKEAKFKLEQEKIAEKNRKLDEQAAKEALKAVPPEQLFKLETDKYSKFDDKGLPTHDAEGNEISKGLYKKLVKMQLNHTKKYQEYLKTIDI